MAEGGRRGFWRWSAPGELGVWLHWTCPVAALGLSGLHLGLQDGARRTDGAGTRLVSAVAAGCLPMASMLVHEAGHALAARRAGMGAASITLTPLAAATLTLDEPRTPAQQMGFALAGPAANLGVAALAFGGAALVPAPLRGLAHMAGWLNAALGLSNLLPSPPLDGGMGARALRWQASGDRGAAERDSHRLGQVVAGGLLGMAAAEAGLRGPGGRLAMLALSALTALASPAVARTFRGSTPGA